jgi:aryl-alcohol dehydrogenase-like predicted oxidoreductase
VETRSIGSVAVPIAGIGCNNFGRRIDEERTKQVVDAALEVGATLFDTADLYGDGRSEEFLGRALGDRREEVVVVSKFGMRTPPDGLTGGHPSWVPRACDASLKRLGTDRIDVYLLHQPDEATPIEDTLSAMSRLVDDGKVREIGCSNFSAKQLDEAADAAAEHGLRRFATVQNEYSLLHTDPRDEVLPACERLALGFLPYFPLASGLLTGKYRRGHPPPEGTRLAGRPERLTDEIFEQVEALEDYAKERDLSLLDVAIGGLAAQPAVVSVIAGATKPEQVRANVRAAQWEPSAEDLEALTALR